MAMLQQLHGHVTRTAYTGPEAVAATTEFFPDVVLLDIGLPCMEDFEVARRIRDMVMIQVLLVALTGYGTEGDRDRPYSHEILGCQSGCHRHHREPDPHEHDSSIFSQS